MIMYELKCLVLLAISRPRDFKLLHLTTTLLNLGTFLIYIFQLHSLLLVYTHPFFSTYLMWLFVVYMNTPMSSQPPLFTLMFSCTVHKHSSFLLHMAISMSDNKYADLTGYVCRLFSFYIKIVNMLQQILHYLKVAVNRFAHTNNWFYHQAF